MTNLSPTECSNSLIEIINQNASLLTGDAHDRLISLRNRLVAHEVPDDEVVEIFQGLQTKIKEIKTEAYASSIAKSHAIAQVSDTNEDVGILLSLLHEQPETKNREEKVHRRKR